MTSLMSYHFIQTNRQAIDIIHYAIPLLIMLSISLLGLKVSLAENQISFQWIWIGFLFKKNRIPMDAIAELRVIKYNFFEGGLGYGIRYSAKYGNVHNVCGNAGLLIKTKKKRLLLGIQKEKAIKAFILENFPSKRNE
ncbi:MAG: hypothetical protein GDA51_03660 [Ekhidna sp.]|nr:hypothetical protein [Ekhidna sp.]